ncbi:MAG TPA: TIGR00266 family protein [Symbiobacteriaceae bacterium]|nr:TIGR00266 family protein [Symbiobacteriaceae bacterium]
MKYEILYQPSYSLAVLQLDPGEEVQAEAGAMVSMSANMALQTEMKGGFFGALGRSILGGESFFTSKYRAEGGPGELTLAPSLPGDVSVLELQGHTMFLKSGAYLAGASGLTIDSKWGGARGFFGGGGLFLLRVQGHGPVIFNTYGALHWKQLAPGEKYVVDTGHVVGFSDGMGFQVRKAAKGWMSSIASGEGLVCEFTGPGLLYMQTRSEEAFLSWLIPKLPTPSNNN